MYQYLHNKCHTDIIAEETRKKANKFLEISHDDAEIKNKKLVKEILPKTFHDICQEFRRSKDLESMLDFIEKYGPKNSI